MNKTKLEVIRINEDVIATSGVTLCSHLNADLPGNTDDHLYVIGFGGAGSCYVDTYSCGDKLTSVGTKEAASVLFKTAPEINTWYYWNGTAYEKCEEQSNDAHPIKTN